MPFLAILAALLAPRVVIVCVFLLSNAFGSSLPFPQLLWGVLGFIMAPFSLLTFTAVQVWGGGEWNPFHLIVMVIAILVDLGAHSGTRTHYVRRYRRTA